MTRPSLDSGVLLSAVGVLAGFGGLLWAWLGASTEVLGARALPWVASGGLGGLALLTVATTMLGIHLRRQAAARELVLLDEATLLAHKLRDPS